MRGVSPEDLALVDKAQNKADCNNENRYVDGAEAARIIGSTKESMANMRQRGVGPAYSKFGRAVRYFIPDLYNHMAAHRVEPVNRRGA